MLKNCIALMSFIFISSAIFSLGSLARADGLDEPLSTLKRLNAPPPPVVEDFLLPLPPEPAEAVVEAPLPEKNLWPIISQGMILSKPTPEGKITASEDQKQMLAQGDTVYLSSFGEAFSPEQEWVVFKTMKDVRHPESGVHLGELIHVLGLAEVTEVNDGVATARLTRSKEPISIGDGIASMDHFIPPSTEIGPPPEGSAGMIVEVRDNRLNVAQNDIVYIDYGSEEGIDPGDRFVVIHGGERRAFGSSPIKKTALPDRHVGSMLVVATQEHTATAKIVQSVEPIAKGDTILYRPKN